MKPEIIKFKSEGAVGPYSNAVKYGNLLFVSGQTGMGEITEAAHMATIRIPA